MSLNFVSSVNKMRLQDFLLITIRNLINTWKYFSISNLDFSFLLYIFKNNFKYIKTNSLMNSYPMFIKSFFICFYF